jgi:peptidoglycan/LPS O-acetylase OafA/YrhL
MGRVLPESVAIVSAPCSRIPSRRLAFLDALRGIAALMVVILHMGPLGPLARPLSHVVPAPLMSIGARGFLGVEIFFVLSGFVIAMSIRNIRITPRFFGNFALRRSLRLDPPYLLTIAIVIALTFLARRFLHSSDAILPSFGDVVAHIFYLPKILNRPLILGVFWTLCLEVQFYIVLVLLVGLVQNLPGAANRCMGWHGGFGPLVFLPLLILSLACWLGWVHLPVQGLFIERWFMFFLGVMVFWTLDRHVKSRWLGIVFALILCTLIFRRSDELGMAVAAGGLIWSVGLLGGLENWLNYRWLQFLGKISYSLYLIHTAVGTRVLNIGQRITHDRVGFAVMWVVLGFIVSILSAWLMYRYIERPGVALGKRLKYDAPRLPTPDDFAPQVGPAATATV